VRRRRVCCLFTCHVCRPTSLPWRLLRRRVSEDRPTCRSRWPLWLLRMVRPSALSMWMTARRRS
jgi:hypothetical protein